MQAIVMKELRENVRLLPVGLLLIGVCLLLITPKTLSYSSSDTSYLMGMSSISASFFAVLLAAAQSWFEFRQSQRGFLFHRPVSRSQILYGKVTAAAIIYAIAYLIPLTCVALWFAYNGPTHFPARPAQVLPAFVMCTLCFVLHPVTMFTIEREANWFGTRLLPLAGTVCALFLFSVGVLAIRETWYLFVILSAIAFALFASLTLISNHPSRSWIVGFGAFSLVIVSAAFVASFLEQLEQNSNRTVSPSSKFAVDQSGNLWFYHYNEYRFGNGYHMVEKALSGDQLRPDKKPDLDLPLPKEFAPAALSTLVHVKARYGGEPFFRSMGDTASGKSMVTDSRGVILVYDRRKTPPFLGMITRSGFHRSGEPIGELFSAEPTMQGFPTYSSLSENSVYISDWLWADSGGVYQFDDQTATFETLVKMQVERFAILLPSLEVGYRLLVQSAGKFHVYALEDKAGQSNWLEAIQRNASTSSFGVASVPKLQATEIHSYPALPADISADYASFGLTNSGKLVAVTSWQTQNYFGSVANDKEANWEASPYISPWQRPQQSPAVLAAISLMPLGLFLFTFIASTIVELANGRTMFTGVSQLPWGIGEGLTLFVVTLIIVTAVSVVLTIFACKRRGLSVSTAVKWALASVLLGLAGPMIVVALYPRFAFETCQRCNKIRRVDRAICEHCASEWEPLAAEGIEILDRNANLVRV